MDPISLSSDVGKSKIPSSLGDLSQSSETPSIQKHAVTQYVKNKEHSGTLDSSVNVHSDTSAKGRTPLSHHKLTGNLGLAIALSPGHSQLFNVAHRKREGLVCEVTCMTCSIEAW